MSATNPPGLLDALFRTDAVRGIFSDAGRLQRMLDFEAALARAQATVGLVPGELVAHIESQCRAELFDIAALAAEAGSAGNPAIPMVKALTARVAQRNAQAANFVHWGATSQDAMDTGLVLQLRDALDVIEADLRALAEALAGLAATHKSTPMAGRTWLQHATPVTFGLKAAGWLDAIGRHRDRLQALRARTLVIQFGGASGTLASLGKRGPDMARALAADLKLGLPDLPWHAHRDRIAEVATMLGLLTGSLGKIARDISLCMQTEVGEAFEPAAPGRGGSSTMPHKRNPVACAAVLAASMRVPALTSVMLQAMVQEHERGLGNWHAEWETLPEICGLCAGALAHVRTLAEGLTVDVPRMRANLELTHGLALSEAVALALAPALGKIAAQGLVEQACRKAAESGRHLREVLCEYPRVTTQLSPAELDRLLDPQNHLGIAGELVDAALARHKAR